MGRAIDMENKIETLDRRLKLVEDALEELVQTRIHHVDLEVGADETFTPPVRIKKTSKKGKTDKVSA